MQFHALALPGAWIVELERREDARGFFARSFCRDEFDAHGLPSEFVQCNVSWNQRRGTLRGMHFQRHPSREGKLVRCTAGAAWDVLIDLRPDSPAYGRWVGIELSADNRRAVYVPPGLAHGFQTLTDGAELFYQMTDVYAPALADGVRWNDPAFAIDWPLADPILSERDASYPSFELGGPARSGELP